MPPVEQAALTTNLTHFINYHYSTNWGSSMDFSVSIYSRSRKH